ncbi:MAG: hypothetical protein FWD21_04120 [Peptococcaceae bacterium]|nr:hypothetical protein [Peptococcaceae bacterium]
MQKKIKLVTLTGILLLLLGSLSGCAWFDPIKVDPEPPRPYTAQDSSAIDLVLDIPDYSVNEILSIPGRIGPGLRVIIDGTEMDIDPFGNFLAQVRLTREKNYIPVRVVSNDGKAIYATSKVVNYDRYANIPRLDVIIPATVTSRDARVIISGATDPDCRINANGNTAQTDENGSFIVNVPLTAGDNIVRLTATNSKGRTSTVQQVVNYSVPVDMQPMLVVSSPEPSPDGFVSTDRIKIVGFTDPYNIIEIYNNYYNGDESVKSLVFKGTIPRNGQFSVDVTLSTTGGGVNDLQIVATNSNGGTATESRRVTYKNLPSPEFNNNEDEYY